MNWNRVRTIHEPSPVGGDIRFLDGEIQIREHLNRLKKNPMLSSTINLNKHQLQKSQNYPHHKPNPWLQIRTNFTAGKRGRRSFTLTTVELGQAPLSITTLGVVNREMSFSKSKSVEQGGIQSIVMYDSRTELDGEEEKEERR